jgi:hypothetical protein
MTYPGVRERLLRWLEFDVVCATGALGLRDPRFELLPLEGVADAVVACSSWSSLATS